ncbi:MAG: SDR family NAD(P)-dependent oxidoreductase [Aquisalinus sp.]|nr:SDR family NAD(P)-dependent oxidoreductase [Aquisalinus sp.]
MAITSLEEKTAFITGGAKGIGLGIARALVAKGSNVMIADIDEGALNSAVQELGGKADAVICDVADPAAVKAAADKTIERFGKVHILVNNAGVGGGGKPGETTLEDWRWVVDINLMGVVYGVEIFVPLIKSHGEGGYIINTASLAGHAVGAGTGGPYNATKFAVVGYSETLRAQLAKHNIGCSALCPAWVDTEIHKSGFRAPSSAGLDVKAAMQSPRFQQMDAVLKSGISPNLVGEWAVDCMLANRMHIFTHPQFAPGIEERMNEVRADYQACADDPRFSE